jgi:phosphoglycerate dehydrogenase-like enzyme
MEAQKPHILVTERLADGPFAWLRRSAQVTEASPNTPAFAAAAPNAVGLVVRTYTTVNDALLARLPSLRVVGRAGVGVDNIDLPACARRGVIVVNTPDANTQAVVEYVLCLLCDALRPRVFLDRALDQAAWDAARNEIAAQRQMSELTLGILGVGRIGTRLAQVAAAIGFHVLLHDLREIDASQCGGGEIVPLTRLLAESHVVSVHVDGRPSNRNFLNADRLAQLRPDVLLINTSRGMVLPASDLARFLAANPKARAVLDVHDPEPIAPNCPLLGLRAAFLAPHLASRSETAMENMSWVVRDVVAVAQGGTPRHPVDAAAVERG